MNIKSNSIALYIIFTFLNKLFKCQIISESKYLFTGSDELFSKTFIGRFDHYTGNYKKQTFRMPDPTEVNTKPIYQCVRLMRYCKDCKIDVFYYVQLSRFCEFNNYNPAYPVDKVGYLYSEQ